MTFLRRLLIAAATTCTSLALTAAPSLAIVGGHDAAPGVYPSIAEITFGSSFLCTGTLIAPNYRAHRRPLRLDDGRRGRHAAGWPAPLIDVRIGSNKSGQGEKVPVSRVIVEPDYLATSGHDITLLQLASNSTKAPTKVAGSGEGSLWTAGTLETIAAGARPRRAATRPTRCRRRRSRSPPTPVRRGVQRLRRPDDGLRGFPQGGVDTARATPAGRSSVTRRRAP